MHERKGEAEWQGTLREGRGTLRVGEGVFQGSYSYASRFGEGQGTNPEELIAAAHAACFSMALAGELAAAGFPPARIRTVATVRLESERARFSITGVHLSTEASVPGIDSALFQEKAAQAKEGCPVSRALAATHITLDARLV